MKAPFNFGLACFLLLFPWKSLSQSSDTSEILTAIIITYKHSFDSTAQKPEGFNERLPYPRSHTFYTSSYKLLVRPITKGFEESVLIYAPPYILSVMGTLSNNAGYLLSKLGDERKFFCTQDEDGISFLPVTQSQSSLKIPVETGQKDTLLGYPVREYSFTFDNGIANYWRIDGTPVFHNTMLPMPSINLLSQNYADGHRNTSEVTSIQLLHLYPKYFTPELNNAPITFQTDSQAFQILGQKMSPFLHSPYVHISGFIPHRRPDQMPRNFKETVIGDPMPKMNKTLFNEQGKMLFPKINGKPCLFILLDYSMLKPIPSFLSKWVNQLQAAFPDVAIVILTTSSKNQIRKGWRHDKTMALLPHSKISKKLYAGFEWQDPLSYVLTNKDSKIVFKQSGFDVHQLSTLEKAFRDTVHHEK